MRGAGASWLTAARRGNYATAWAINDVVLASRPGPADDPTLPYHLRYVWDGRPFEGRHLLVRCYHGLGDTLQFVRYVPALRRHAASVTLEAQAELLPVLVGLQGIDRLIPFQVEAPAPPSECDIESMELAHALRLPPEAAPPPYLAVPEPVVATARHQLGGGLLVGVCAEAGDWDQDRSVPLPVLIRALAREGAAGTHLARLQRGTSGDIQWVNPADTLADIMRTATLIAAVDVVVTVDTMVAHLAGALGRPTCLLLKAEADWRWMERRRDSPWYPSMRLYRQQHPGDWRAPLAELSRDLAALTPPPSPPACGRAG